MRHILHPERLSQAWVRRRVAWQAISDLLLGGHTTETDTVAALWQPISAFLARMPPQCRNLVGLTRDLDDPDLVRGAGRSDRRDDQGWFAGNGGSLERALLLPA